METINTGPAVVIPTHILTELDQVLVIDESDWSVNPKNDYARRILSTRNLLGLHVDEYRATGRKMPEWMWNPVELLE